MIVQEAAIIRAPTAGDGRTIWELARDCAARDLHSPSTYALRCRDFAGTTVVAHDADGVCGFLIAYARPEEPDTLFVWQTAVAPRRRGRRLAGRMLQHVVRDRFRFVECSVAPGDESAIRFLAGFALTRGGAVDRAPLFGPDVLPRDNDPDDLLRIGPLTPEGE